MHTTFRPTEQSHQHHSYSLVVTKQSAHHQNNITVICFFVELSAGYNVKCCSTNLNRISLWQYIG